MIQQAHIRTSFPNKLIVRYSLREPIAFLGDFSNAAIDRLGYVFPFAPFFSPKTLPKIFLQTPPTSFGDQIDLDSLEKAFALFDRLAYTPLKIEVIDLSKSQAPLIGRREIVVELVDKECHWTLRFFPKELDHQLERFLSYKSILQKEGGDKKRYLVDLRIEKLAYIKSFASVQ